MNWHVIVGLGLATAVALGAHAPAPAEPPSWTLREELRLGNAPGPADDLKSISAAVIGRDGAVMVLSRAGDLAIFDRDGRFVRRSRVLPGAPAMGWVGDTLWIVAQLGRRLTFFDGRGEVLGTMAYSAEIEGYAGGVPIALLCDRSLLRTIVPGSPQVPSPLPVPPPPDQYRMPVIPAAPLPVEDSPGKTFLVRTSPEGRVLQGLEIFASSRTTVPLRDQYGAMGTADYPFGDEPLVAVTPDGSEIVVVERYAASRPGPANYSIARFDVAAGKRTARHHEYTPAPIEPRQTPFSALLAGADRTVWLRETGSDRWVAHAADGRVAGRVSLPARARPVYADHRAIWVASDLPSPGTRAQVVVRYRIVKP